MKYLLLLAFVFFFNSGYSQKGLQIVTLDQQDVTNADFIYAGIINLKDSPYKFHIRYIRPAQIIDLYSNDSLNFKGQIVNSIFEMKTKKERYIPKKYIYDISTIDSLIASKMGHEILKNKYYMMPTDSIMKGYNTLWLDCDGIGFEYKIDDTIITASYSCPEHQIIENPEIEAFDKYYHLVDTTLSLDESRDKFRSKLKKRTFYGDEFMNVFYITRKKKKKDQSLNQIP